MARRVSPRALLLAALAIGALGAGLASCEREAVAPPNADGPGESGRDAAMAVERPPGSRRVQRESTRVSGTASQPDSDDDTWMYLVKGTVRRPDGQPQAGALVVLGDLDHQYRGCTISDATGAFGFESDGDYSSLTAIAEVDGETLSGHVRRAFYFEGDITLAPRAPENRIQLVRLVDAEGRAVRTASVRVLDDFEPVVDKRVVAGSGGKLILDGPSWIRPRLFVTAAQGEDGALVPRIVRSWIDAAGEAAPPIELQPGRSLRGRVLLPDGRPAAGAEIEIDPPMPDGFDSDHMDAPSLTTETDDDGRFAIDGLAEGTALLSVGAAPGSHGGGAVSATAGETDVEVRLSAEWRVRLRIRDEDGAPVVGARVFSWLGRVQQIGDEIVVDGLRAGRPIELTVYARGFISADVGAEQPPDEPIVVTLRRDAPIRGRAWGPDGRPLRDVRIVVRRPSGRAAGSRPRWLDDGRFEVGGLLAEDGPVVVSIGDGSGAVGAVTTLPGTDDVELQWPAEVRLVLLLPRVVLLPGVEERPPLGIVRVVVRSGGDELDVARTERIATFDLLDAPPTVDVQIGPDESGLAAYLRGLPASGFHRVSWAQTFAVRGIVRRPDGLEPGRLSGVVRVDGGFEIPFETTVRGHFAVSGVPAGTHEVEVRANGLRATERFDIPGDGAGHGADFVLDLRPE